MTTRDHYQLLRVLPTASLEEIRRQYRRLMLSGAHPDKGGDPELAKQMNLAYEVLKDPASRARYDQQRGFGASRSARGATPAGAGTSGARTGSGARYPDWWDDFAAPPPPPPRSRRPPPPPRPRILRCGFCEAQNRVPADRRLDEGRCGSCGAGFGRGWRLQMAARLREAARLKKAGKRYEAMGIYHQLMKEWPANSVPYLEAARLFRDWGLERQSELHRELAARFGKVTFEGDEDVAA